jgi:hypothetical protein
MESDDFYFEIVFYKDVAKSKEYVKEIYNKFLKKYGYSKNDITWKLTSKGIGFSSSSENIGFDLEDYILDNMYKYGDYEFETDYKLMESKNSARKSINESVDKTFFDLMCDKDFFKGVAKQVTKKEKCQFDFYKTPNSYTWLITYKENESLSINMDERTNDIFIHVTKNGKSEKDFKFPQLTFDDSVDELLEIIFDYVQGNFDSSWYESKVV